MPILPLVDRQSECAETFELDPEAAPPGFGKDKAADRH
jgi:hypothetical protein